MVTITDINNCTIQDSITISTLPIYSVNLGNDTVLCLGESLTLEAITPNTVAYLWQDNSTQATYTVTTDGSYFVEITDNNGCLASDTILITYAQIELLQPLGDTTICEGTQAIFDATATNAIQYVWQDGSTSPTFSTSEAGDYSVTVTNNYNCTADFTVNVAVDLPPQTLWPKVQVD